MSLPSGFGIWHIKDTLEIDITLWTSMGREIIAHFAPVLQTSRSQRTLFNSDTDQGIAKQLLQMATDL